MKRRFLTGSAVLAFALVIIATLVADGDPGLTSTYEGPARNMSVSLDYGGVPSIYNTAGMDIALIGRVVHIDGAPKSKGIGPETRIQFEVDEMLGVVKTTDRSRYGIPNEGDRVAFTYFGGELEDLAYPTGLHLSLGDRVTVFAFAFPPTFSASPEKPRLLADSSRTFKINADDTVTVREPYAEAGSVPAQTLIAAGRALGQVVRQPPLPSTPPR